MSCKRVNNKAKQAALGGRHPKNGWHVMWRDVVLQPAISLTGSSTVLGLTLTAFMMCVQMFIMISLKLIGLIGRVCIPEGVLAVSPDHHGDCERRSTTAAF